MLEFFYYLNSLHTLSEEAQGALTKVVRQKELRKGQVWLQEGAVCDKISFIARGLAKLYFETNTKELVIHFAREDEWILSANSFFQQIPSDYSIRAVEACSIIYIPFVDLHAVLQKHIELNIHFRLVYEQQLKLHEIHMALLLLNPRDRFEMIGKYFPRMFERKRLTDRMLAAYLGITPNGLCNFRKRTGRSY